MQVETKFNIDNYVWFLGNGCIARKRILSISINIYSKEGNPSVKYDIEDTQNPMSEHVVFETKEDLLQSL